MTKSPTSATSELRERVEFAIRYGISMKVDQGQPYIFDCDDAVDRVFQAIAEAIETNSAIAISYLPETKVVSQRTINHILGIGKESKR